MEWLHVIVGGGQFIGRDAVGVFCDGVLAQGGGGGGEVRA